MSDEGGAQPISHPMQPWCQTSSSSSSWGCRKSPWVAEHALPVEDVEAGCGNGWGVALRSRAPRV
eukprot:13330039-Alexandrium_andersonii.AAC.1